MKKSLYSSGNVAWNSLMSWVLAVSPKCRRKGTGGDGFSHNSFSFLFFLESRAFLSSGDSCFIGGRVYKIPQRNLKKHWMLTATVHVHNNFEKKVNLFILNSWMSSQNHTKLTLYFVSSPSASIFFSSSDLRWLEGRSCRKIYLLAANVYR